MGGLRLLVAVDCGILVRVTCWLQGGLAGPCLLVGSSGDAGCPLDGFRAVMRRMLLEL